MKQDLKKYSEAHQIAKQMSEAVRNGSPVEDYEQLALFLSQNENRDELMVRFGEASETPEIRMRVKVRNSESDLNKMFSKIDAWELRRRSFRRVLITSSASIAALFVFAVLLFNKMDRDIVVSSSLEFSQNVMVPTLILEDGEIIKIESKNPAKFRKYKILLSENKIESASNVNEMSKPIYRTLVIPHQCRYTVVLEDSTEVVLNADSRLKYPVRFMGDSREVEIEGEAYFKVKKSDKPFIVKCGTSSITVYGTEFNVRSGKNILETLLVKGRVGVKPFNGKEIIMVPNTLLCANESDVTVSDIAPEDYISWIDGVFYYDEQPLGRVLDDMAKWYGVSFKYSRELSEIKVSFKLTKETKIESAIEFMQQIIGKLIIKEERGIYSIE